MKLNCVRARHNRMKRKAKGKGGRENRKYVVHGREQGKGKAWEGRVMIMGGREGGKGEEDEGEGRRNYLEVSREMALKRKERREKE